MFIIVGNAVSDGSIQNIELSRLGRESDSSKLNILSAEIFNKLFYRTLCWLETLGIEQSNLLWACKFRLSRLKVEALWFKCFIVFLENLVLGTFICADNESKIKKIGQRFRFWDIGVAKTIFFLSKSHDLPHKVIREVRQININVLQKAKNASFIFLIFTHVKVYLKGTSHVSVFQFSLFSTLADIFAV